MGRSRSHRRRRAGGRAKAGRKLAAAILLALATAILLYLRSTGGALGDLAGGLLGQPTAAPGQAHAPATALPAQPGAAAQPQADGRALLGADYPRRPEGLERAQVLKVIDGDTLDVQLGGQEVRLRLIGLDTPESVDPRQPVECFGVEASNRAKELLGSQVVLLEADPGQDERDRFGRLLRFVWLEDGRLFNLEMIAQGYAFEYTYANPYKYQAAFRLAEQRARENRLGLWAPTTCNGERRPAEKGG
ncbi:MAG TPA: thermonuclease family protein [Roseiflexaceae bacterium]|nr:thermonuclease family protein [Roseiflexaceae bacterium]